jgi:tetratricopeptide (TPR) repeat protein
MEATLEHELPPALRTRALIVATSMAYAQGDYRTAERALEAMQLSRRQGDVVAEVYAWSGRGLVEMANQDYQAAAFSLEKAIALHKRCGEDFMAATVRVILGTTLLLQGEDERADRTFEEALAAARRLKVPSLTYIALYNAAQSALARGDLEKAARMLGEGIEWSERTKDKANLAYYLEALAVVAASRRQAERCALLLGAAEGLLEEVGARVYNYNVPDPSLRERAAAKARSALSDAAFEKAREEGRDMTLEEAIAYALKDGDPPSL